MKSGRSARNGLVSVERNKLISNSDRVSSKRLSNFEAFQSSVRSTTAPPCLESALDWNAVSTTRPRTRAPVFIVGCPRSGTTLLYDFLIRGGSFANYRAESVAFSVLGPAFGNLSYLGNRRRLIDCWLKSRLFEVSGLDADKIRRLMMSDCRSTGDFLRIQMEQIAFQQGLLRWAEKTPDHSLYISEIERQIPGSLFVHLIRDGRDVALSYSRLGWSRPLPWDQQGGLFTAAMYWKWIVRRARNAGAKLGDRYLEVRFEDLVRNPRETILNVGGFVGERLNFDHILKLERCCLKRPNTAFPDEFTCGEFNPVGRWQKKLSKDQIYKLEALVGTYLSELGYGLANPSAEGLALTRMRLISGIYQTFLDSKQWLKSKTLLGRLVDLSRMEVA